MKKEKLKAPPHLSAALLIKKYVDHGIYSLLHPTDGKAYLEKGPKLPGFASWMAHSDLFLRSIAKMTAPEIARLLEKYPKLSPDDDFFVRPPKGVRRWIVDFLKAAAGQEGSRVYAARMDYETQKDLVGFVLVVDKGDEVEITGYFIYGQYVEYYDKDNGFTARTFPQCSDMILWILGSLPFGLEWCEGILATNRQKFEEEFRESPVILFAYNGDDPNDDDMTDVVFKNYGIFNVMPVKPDFVVVGEQSRDGNLHVISGQHFLNQQILLQAPYNENDIKRVGSDSCPTADVLTHMSSNLAYMESMDGKRHGWLMQRSASRWAGGTCYETIFEFGPGRPVFKEAVEVGRGSSQSILFVDRSDLPKDSMLPPSDAEISVGRLERSS